MTIEAMKQALEALEETRNALAWFYDSYPQDVTQKGNDLLPHVETVLTAIREALAEQPAQPATYTCGVCGVSMQMEQPAQPQQEPVAWPHKWGCRANAFGECNMGCTSPQPAQQQEPVATVADLTPQKRHDFINDGWDSTDPLYTSPPASKPLTDEQMFEMAEIAWRHGWASCRDADYVGEEAEDERWGMVGAEVVQDIADLGIKGDA